MAFLDYISLASKAPLSSARRLLLISAHLLEEDLLVVKFVAAYLLGEVGSKKRAALCRRRAREVGDGIMAQLKGKGDQMLAVAMAAVESGNITASFKSYDEAVRVYSKIEDANLVKAVQQQRQGGGTWRHVPERVSVGMKVASGGTWRRVYMATVLVAITVASGRRDVAARNGARLLQVARTRCKSVARFEVSVGGFACGQNALTVYAHLIEGYEETIKTVEEAIVLFEQAGEASKGADAVI
ncbi:hypothetical protein T484DRAFT_1813328 [Baffinella frigidus]|nr:hypothetical protein T484DRAFT_1813328 [Cryptophyta sp. CCMP2293]